MPHLWEGGRCAFARSSCHFLSPQLLLLFPLSSCTLPIHSSHDSQQTNSQKKQILCSGFPAFRGVYEESVVAGPIQFSLPCPLQIPACSLHPASKVLQYSQYSHCRAFACAGAMASKRADLGAGPAEGSQPGSWASCEVTHRQSCCMCLSFLICKMVIIAHLPHRVDVRMNVCEHLNSASH